MGLLPLKRINYKNIIFILVFWLLLLIIFKEYFLFYLGTYAEFSANYDIGLSTSTLNLHSKDLIFWPIYVFTISILLADSIYTKSSIYINSLKYIFLIVILYQFTSYGYGRIDSGFSRLISLGIPLVYVASQLSGRFNLLSKCILIAVFLLYCNISLPGLISKEVLQFSNQKNSPLEINDVNKK